MNFIFDLLFPKRCVSCRRFGSFFCRDCLSQLRKTPDICPICERPSLLGATHPLCKTKYSLDGLTSAFIYNKPIKNAIHRFKYKPYITSLTPILGSLFIDAVKDKKGFTYFLKQKPALVPIPLHWWRKHIRGYNQALILANQLSKKLKIPVFDFLKRKKLTKPQSEVSFNQRKKNVADIFDIDKKYQEKIPKTVLLFDDLWTTGATLKSACQVLKRKGANLVWGLTLAR